ncbi:hypothetical protein [Streptomyces sp. NPDC006879]|uniref:hypothetical protein n=1 Tax=Streptomyces sp. NPDC006879 TaxID=3364767 RepID=UPI0036B9411E
MFFRRSHRPAVRLVLPGRRPRTRRSLPVVPPLPEGWQPSAASAAGTEPDAEEIKLRERLLAALGEVARWAR